MIAKVICIVLGYSHDPQFALIFMTIYIVDGQLLGVEAETSMLV